MQEVTIWAMKDVRELSASDEALEAAARSARCAAFATAAACIAATQDKEGLFANPLKMPGKSADQQVNSLLSLRSATAKAHLKRVSVCQRQLTYMMRKVFVGLPPLVAKPSILVQVHGRGC